MKHLWVTAMLGDLEKLNRVKAVEIQIRRMLGNWALNVSHKTS
jgi:hypothetical protein